MIRSYFLSLVGDLLTISMRNYRMKSQMLRKLMINKFRVFFRTRTADFFCFLTKFSNLKPLLLEIEIGKAKKNTKNTDYNNNFSAKSLFNILIHLNGAKINQALRTQVRKWLSTFNLYHQKFQLTVI